MNKLSTTRMNFGEEKEKSIHELPHDIMEFDFIKSLPEIQRAELWNALQVMLNHTVNQTQNYCIKRISGNLLV